VEANGVYLYCFARPGAARGIAAPGVGTSGAVSEVQLGPLAAVVSPVSLEEFSEAPGHKNTQNPDWLIPRACRHQRVVREAMARSGVLPVRFGAVFSSEQRLAELVQAKHAEIADFLDSVEGKEEWAVKGTLDPARATARLRETDRGARSEIRNQKSEMASPGARYLADRKAQLAARERLRPWCLAVADRVAAELDAAAEAARPLKLYPCGNSTQAGQMFFHRAFLLPRESVGAFLEHVERIGREIAQEGLALAPSGPWPPYSFAPSLWEAAEGCGAASIEAQQESGGPQAAGVGGQAPQVAVPQGATAKAGSHAPSGTAIAQAVSNLL